MKVGNKFIGNGEPCFVIAEAGVNHNGELSLAKKLVGAASSSGADAVKFQTFRSDDIVTKKTAQANYQVENTGKKETYFKMLKRLELSYDDFTALKEYSDRKKIIFLSTPHSCNADADLVAELCPAIKVASGDLTNLPFLAYVAKKQLPILLATGMSMLEEVREAVGIIRPINDKLVLLHCTTNYPTLLKEVNLRAMSTMRKAFGLPVGYSDHTEGVDTAVVAAAMSACVIEKHLTLDKKMKGPDHKASLEPFELREMVSRIRRVERKKITPEKAAEQLGLLAVLGNGIKKPTESEIKNMRVIRKSVVAASEIRRGDAATEQNITIKRPGTGLHPRNYWSILGKTAKRNIKKDEIIRMEDFG